MTEFVGGRALANLGISKRLGGFNKKAERKGIIIKPAYPPGCVGTTQWFEDYFTRRLGFTVRVKVLENYSVRLSAHRKNITKLIKYVQRSSPMPTGVLFYWHTMNHQQLKEGK